MIPCRVMPRPCLLLLAVPLLAGAARAEPAIRRLQLVTVTDTSAVFTWETTEPADAVVLFGEQRGRLDRSAAGAGGPSRFHHCKLTGLRPGKTYYYTCKSGNATAAIGAVESGRFVTLTPPPGREVFSFATMTDLHVGQQRTARLVLHGKVVSEGVQWREPGLSFWQLAVGASIDEINRIAPAFTIIKGDVTEGQSVEEFPKARRLLEGLARPYHVVRGNHDALNPFLKTFGLPRPWYGFDAEGFHFVVLDTEPLATRDDPALDRQWKWLADDLKTHRGAWTFVFVHRPVPPKLARPPGTAIGEDLLRMSGGLVRRLYGPDAEHSVNRALGYTANVSERHARRLAELLRGHGRIAGVFAGHLHRNYVGTWPEETGNLPYVETASTKEYPCGYAVTRVFTGGYMHNYYVPRDPRCLEWSAMTRDAYSALGLQSKAGTLSDRNFVVRFDALNLAPTTAPAAP